MTAPVLSVQELDIRYRLPAGRWLQAVTQVSFAVTAGQVVGLVGESGCGKSSVVKAIVGLQRPSSGHIQFDGQDVWQASRKTWQDKIANRIGVVFQDPTSSLNPRMTIRELLTDPMRIHHVGTKDERAARAAELMDLVRLPVKALGQLPRELSGGQRQRVAIARAVALRPALLVADEPTSALDVSIRNQLLNLLLDLRDELDLAMLVISHDITAVTYLADAINVMYLGRIVESGSAATVHDHFEHPYTATLLSARPTLASVGEGESTGEGTGEVAAARPSDLVDEQAAGCPFVPRCWRSVPECSAAFPPDASPQAGHVVHCLRPLPAQQPVSAPGPGADSEEKNGDHANSS
jgi:peptide/nickel transport system ATP-binding protein